MRTLQPSRSFKKVRQLPLMLALASHSPLHRTKLVVEEKEKEPEWVAFKRRYMANVQNALRKKEEAKRKAALAELTKKKKKSK